MQLGPVLPFPFGVFWRVTDAGTEGLGFSYEVLVGLGEMDLTGILRGLSFVLGEEVGGPRGRGEMDHSSP